MLYVRKTLFKVRAIKVMANPVRRPNSRYPWFQVDVPADILAKLDKLPPDLRRQFPLYRGKPAARLRRSLGTVGPREAGLKNAQMQVEWGKRFAQARAFLSGAQQPASLLAMEVAALTGEWYRQRLAEWEENPGSPHGWEASGWSLVDALRDASRRERQRLGLPVADDPADDDDDMRVPCFSGRLNGCLAWIEQEAAGILAASGRIADTDSRVRLAASLADNALSLLSTTERHARGDYSPDATLGSFPKVEPASGLGPQVEPLGVESVLSGKLPQSQKPEIALPGLTFAALREGYLKEGSDGYDRVRGSKRYLDRLAAFLRHSDASRVTKADIVRWKEYLLKKGLKPQSLLSGISGL